MHFLLLAALSLSSVAEIREACRNDATGRTFCVRATIASRQTHSLIQDDTGSIILYGGDLPRSTDLVAGDLIEAKGRIIRLPPNFAIPYADEVRHLSSGPAPQPTDTTIADVLAGRNDEEYVRFDGTVFDALYDDVDEHFTFFIIRQGDAFVYAHLNDRPPKATLADYVGAEVNVDGIVTRATPRDCLGRSVGLRGLDALKITRPAAPGTDRTQDLFDRPEPDLLGGSGWMQRRRAEGRVLAVWHGKRILLRAADGRLVRVELADDPLPACGDLVEAVGFPETDLFSLNLVRATWHGKSGKLENPASAKPVAGSDLFQSDTGIRRINTSRYGELLRVRGTVRAVSAPESGERVFRLDCDGFELTVDVGNHPESLSTLSVGATVEVCGVAVLDTLPWRPQTPFPHIQGLRLVMQGPGGLTVTKPAPWWTPRRLFALVGILLAVIVAILIWNASLRLLAERRGHALLRARVNSLTSKLKAEERTRLAVELHDSLAQNLTGVSMELEAALRSGADGTEAVNRHLSVADRALKSCRSDLRNALWDLRNQALEERDMESAIRKTLLPHVKGVALDVRFPVSRARLSDQDAHQILSVVRELVLNALRHGGATEIAIVGELGDGRLAFSVRDNGCGFDPEDCPGVTEGHFGLQGIRERLRALSGKLAFIRNPEGGMTATAEAKA